MKPERWQQIREVFEQALELDPSERDAFLDRRCAADADLRHEVGSLLLSDQAAGDFLNTVSDAPVHNDRRDRPIAGPSANDPWIGKQVGPYRIVERIGFGGMGIVYGAEDIRLGRSAALKFLNVEMQRDTHARQRFDREARAASALNHPNICTIYGVDEFEGHPYLAMEMLRGRSLDQLIRDKPLEIARVLEISISVLSALEAAHAEGIIHRDLKPGNIFLTEKGQVKILDFGLAKQSALETVVTGTQATDATEPGFESLTTSGVIVGTISYMSPEQARGEHVDARSDLFSFGAVLYEMVTGQKAFPGKVPVLVFDAILNRAPVAPSQSNPLIARILEEIISKSLEKDRARRYQSASEMLADIRRFQQDGHIETVASAAAPAKPRTRTRRSLALALLLLIVATAGVYYAWGPLMQRNHDAAQSPAASTARPAVAVLGFENLSDKPENEWLSTTFSEMLSTELATGGRLRVASGEDVARVRRELKLGEVQTYSKDTLERIRHNLGVDYVVVGSYLAPAGANEGELRLDARLQDARSGEILASVPETGREADLIPLLSRTGADLRAKLGVGGVGTSDITKVAATIPKNIDAARLYAEGLMHLRELDPGGARDILLKAVAVEPDHPLIHAALSEAWSQLGYDAKSQAEARQAASLAGQLPQSDQLWVEGRFRESTHEWDKAIDVYRTLLGLYPDNLEYGLRLSAVQANSGHPADAVSTVSVLRKLPAPANTDPRIDLAEAAADEISADFKHEREVAVRAYQEALSRGSRLLAARAQYAQAWAAINTGDMKGAAKLAEDARATYVAAGDRNGEASMLRTLGTVDLMQGELSAALKYYEDSLRLTRQIGNRYGEGAALNQIASVLERQGQHSEALDRYQKVLAIMRETGNRLAESIALNNIANIHWARGDLEIARNLYEQVMDIAQRMGDRSGQAGAATNIGHILMQQGDLSGARHQIDQAIALANEIGEQSILGEATNTSGELYLEQAELPLARQTLQKALSLRQTLGDQLGIGETRVTIAELLMAEGHASDAEKMLEAAVDGFRKASSQDQEITSVGVLARALLIQGRSQDASRAIGSVRSKAMAIEDPYVRSNFLIDAARVQASAGTLSAARDTLNKVIQTANAHGFVNTQLRARLALAEIEHKHGDASKGAKDLVVLREDASSRGFHLIARQAGSLQSL